MTAIVVWNLSLLAAIQCPGSASDCRISGFRMGWAVFAVLGVGAPGCRLARFHRETWLQGGVGVVLLVE